MEAFQFHPAVARWFEQEFGSPSEPQERGWPAIQVRRPRAYLCAHRIGEDAGGIPGFARSALSRGTGATTCPMRRVCSTSLRSRRSATTFTRIWSGRWQRFDLC